MTFNSNRFMTIRQAAKALEIPENFIRREVRAGHVPSFPSGESDKPRFYIDIQKWKEQMGISEKSESPDQHAKKETVSAEKPRNGNTDAFKERSLSDIPGLIVKGAKRRGELREKTLVCVREFLESGMECAEISIEGHYKNVETAYSSFKTYTHDNESVHVFMREKRLFIARAEALK